MPRLAQRIRYRWWTGPEGTLTSPRPATTWVLEITVHAPQPLTDWLLGMGLDTPLGQVVYGTHTGLLDAPIPDLAAGETRTLTVLLPDLRLGQGEYFIHGALATTSGEEIHRLALGRPGEPTGG